MGSGNNYGLKHVKTDYALILNPDLTCEKGFFDNISETIDSAKDFTIIGCQYLHDKVFMPAGFFDERENDKFKDKFKNNNKDLLDEISLSYEERFIRRKKLIANNGTEFLVNI